MKITDELLYAHAAAGQALWLSTLPDPAELDPFVPSRWFQRKMKKLLRQCRRTPRVNAAIRYTKRVALAALVSAVVIFSSLMTVASFRAKVVEVITEVFDTLTSYIFRSQDSNLEALTTIQFGWLPEGVIETVRDEDKYFRYIRYEDSIGNFIACTQASISQSSTITSIEDAEYINSTPVLINGYSAQLIEKDGHSTITWATESEIISLYSSFPSAILLTVSENIILTD